MAGPWEQFQQAAPVATGPWAQFQSKQSSGIPTGRRDSSDYTTKEKILGAIEAGAGIVTGAVTAPLVEASKVYGTLTSGKYGTQEGIQAGEKYGAEFAKNFYQPRTRAGQEYLQNVGEAISSTGLQGVPLPVLEQAAQVIRPALRATTDIARAEGTGAANVIMAPLKAAKEAELQGNIRRSYQNAAIIDAAKLAQEHGIAVNPVVANPTAKNRAKSIIYGTTTMDPYFSQQNAPKWTNLVKKDIGIGADVQLNSQTFDKALDAASKPYEAVRNTHMLPNDKIVSDLEAIRVTPTIGGENAANAVNKLVDSAQSMLTEGRSGNDVLRDIRQLRRNATSVYQSQKAGMAPDPAAVATADASMKLANVLEDLIDVNAKDPATLTKLREARTRMAQIYDFERATDPITGMVDPQEFAKMLRNNKPMTGLAADLGKIAGTFPGIAEVKPNAIPLTPSLQRGGAGGVIGATIGGTLAGPVGAALGMVTGATTGATVRPLMARRFGTPEAQSRFAIPKDYRPPVNQLRPAEPSYTPNQPVPYDYSQQTFTPPNFIFAESEPAPVRVTPSMPETNRLLGAPSAESTLNALRTEDARRAAMSRAMGQEAEARAAATEAAARRPTSGEVILEVDPFTGRLREASQGIKGATPETFSNFGSALDIAANKVGSGQRFALTAAEKVAWDKTKVDLAEVAPGFKTLTDKAIAERMQDRAWIEQTAAKAREKAAAFEQIAARAADERARQAAFANRERMMDLADQMEETLRAPRPVSGKGQGPKTRAAIRNQLLGGETENALTR